MQRLDSPKHSHGSDDVGKYAVCRATTLLPSSLVCSNARLARRHLPAPCILGMSSTCGLLDWPADQSSILKRLILRSVHDLTARAKQHISFVCPCINDTGCGSSEPPSALLDAFPDSKTRTCTSLRMRIQKKKLSIKMTAQSLKSCERLIL